MDKVVTCLPCVSSHSFIQTGRDESSTVTTEDKPLPVELKTATDDDHLPKKTDEELPATSSETNLKTEAKE